jgi:hypothetical protein
MFNGAARHFACYNCLRLRRRRCAAKLQELKVGAHATMPAGVSHFGLHGAGNVVEVFGVAPFVVKFVNPEDGPNRASKK